jgi:hypothetical protein
VNANVELVTLKKLFYFAGSSIMGKWTDYIVISEVWGNNVSKNGMPQQFYVTKINVVFN